MLSLKQMRLMVEKSVYPTQLHSQLFFSHLFVSHVPSASSCLSSAQTDTSKGHLKLFFKAIQVSFQLPADCSIHSFIMKMFSPSAIITKTETFRSTYPLLKEGRMIKKSYTTFPFTVVHEFCLNRFFALTDDFDFRDDFLKESSLLQRSP